jgi:valyl-tRNA synthetase
MTDAAGAYAGMTVEECRRRFVADLITAKQLVEQRDHIMSLGHCYRCETLVEPLPKEQWFVAVDKQPQGGGLTLKEHVLTAVVDKHVTITPERFSINYQRWAENLADWCVSRQIWYGHRVPAYYFNDGATLVTDQLPVDVLWTRHGATAMTEQTIIQGASKKTDVGLSTEGREEASHLAAALKDSNVDVILSSPLKRAKDTAAIVAKLLGLKVIVEPLLTERDYGVAEGKTMAEVEKQFPDYAIHRRTALITKAETAEQLEQRVLKLFAIITKKYRGKKVVCVTHNGLLRAALHHLTGQEMETTAERVPPAEICANCRTTLIAPSPTTGSWRCEQDRDTLDTWFSSSLWTFSTLGWPDKTTDLKTYHPTNWMETGYDLSNLWVSRMVMMSHYLLGQWPFKDVFMHGLVRDEQGRKMSKSLGNGINPLDVIPRFGADALRLALVANTAPGNDMKLSEEKIAGFRNFANKLWNIGRFVLHTAPDAKPTQILPNPKTPAEIWVTNRLHQTIQTVTNDLEHFQFSHAIEVLHHFTWDELADWYLEVSKLQPNPKLLAYLLTQTLIVWHPFCPFVTEAIWQNFAKPKKKIDLLIVQRWPRVGNRKRETEHRNTETPKHQADNFEMVIDLVSQIRAQRAGANMAPGTTMAAIVSVDENTAKLLTEYALFIERSAKCALKIDPTGATTFKINYELPADETKLAKERENLQNYIANIQAKLDDQTFVAKAPAKVVKEQRNKLAEAEEKLKHL